ncbi:MAG: phosphoglycerate kinase [Patescibacteria group bacterium]
MKLKLPQPQDVFAKTVLLRTDYNVPLKKGAKQWQVADAQRIERSLETIGFLLKNQAKIVVISHLGRPSGREERFSLFPVVDELEKMIGKSVVFLDDMFDADTHEIIKNAPAGSVFLVQNLRFYPEEKKNDIEFAKKLAQLADVYINEAFSNSHRTHASMVGVTNFLPSYAGFNLAREVENLTKLTENPTRPFIALIGGAKISDKVEAIENLAHLADAVLVGGGVANNFLKAEGIEIHKSYLQDVPADLKKEGINYVKVADELIEQHRSEHILKDGYIPLPKIIYPADAMAAPTAVMDEDDKLLDNFGVDTNSNIPSGVRIDESSKSFTDDEINAHEQLFNNGELDTESKLFKEEIDLTHDIDDTDNDRDLMYLDIGPKTIKLYCELIANAGTIFWNGPMGVFEKPDFSVGTQAIAEAIAQATSRGAISILGGGDTIAAIDHFELSGNFSFVSTAGGASLEFLSGKEMPGLVAVCQK